MSFSDVIPLGKNDFWSLHHEFTLRVAEDITIDETIEQIWMSDDSKNVHFDATSVNDSAENNHTNQSETCGNSTMNSIALSHVTVTLSLHSLLRLNVMAISDDPVAPTSIWENAYYFSERLKYCLKKLYRNEMDPLCSFAWPHIMRGNSLILIGENFRNKILCMPTLCSIVHVSKLEKIFSFKLMDIENIIS